MKKTLSVLMSLVMAISIFCSLSTTSFAKENTRSTAYELTLDSTKKVSYSVGDCTMWLKFTAPEKGWYEFEQTNPYYSNDDDDWASFITLYDGDYEEIGFSGVDEASERCVVYVNCVAGETYYLEVDNYPSEGSTYTANITAKKHSHTYKTSYQEKAYVSEDVCESGSIEKYCTRCDYEKETAIPAIKSISLSTTAYTYNSEKTRKPKVTVKDTNGDTVSSDNYTVTYADGRKKVGKYKVKVKFTGNYYTGYKNVYFKINPKGTSISSITAKTKGFTVKWKAQKTQTTGYQIRYSTSSSMSSATKKTISDNTTTSKTISDLKAAKKYYVQVRTYKTVDGTKFYSAWSDKVSVTTKGSSSTSSGTNASTGYVGNKNTKTFHRTSCASAKRMSSANKAYLGSRSTFINKGYTPCKTCKP